MTSLVDRPLGQFGAADALVCRECGSRYALGPLHVCELCFGPLEISYDLDRQRLVTRESIAYGPPTIWRFLEFHLV